MILDDRSIRTTKRTLYSLLHHARWRMNHLYHFDRASACEAMQGVQCRYSNSVRLTVSFSLIVTSWYFVKTDIYTGQY